MSSHPLEADSLGRPPLPVSRLGAASRPEKSQPERTSDKCELLSCDQALRTPPTSWPTGSAEARASYTKRTPRGNRSLDANVSEANLSAPCFKSLIRNAQFLRVYHSEASHRARISATTGASSGASSTIHCSLSVAATNVSTDSFSRSARELPRRAHGKSSVGRRPRRSDPSPDPARVRRACCSTIGPLINFFLSNDERLVFFPTICGS